MRQYAYVVREHVRLDPGTELVGLSAEQVRRRRHLLESVRRGVHRITLRPAGFLVGEQLRFTQEPPHAIRLRLIPDDAGEEATPRAGRKSSAKKSQASGTKSAPDGDGEDRLQILRLAIEELGDRAFRTDGKFAVGLIGETAGFATTAAELALLQAADDAEGEDAQGDGDGA